jgi:hypothetical protein
MGYLLDNPNTPPFVVYLTDNMPTIQAAPEEVPIPTPDPVSRTKRSTIVINLEVEEFTSINQFINALGDVSKIAIFKDEITQITNELQNLDYMFRFFTKTMIGYYSKYSSFVFGLENTFNSYSIVLNKKENIPVAVKLNSMKKIKSVLAKHMGTDLNWYWTPTNAINTLKDVIQKEITQLNAIKPMSNALPIQNM